LSRTRQIAKRRGRDHSGSKYAGRTAHETLIASPPAGTVTLRSAIAGAGPGSVITFDTTMQRRMERSDQRGDARPKGTMGDVGAIER